MTRYLAFGVASLVLLIGGMAGTAIAVAFPNIVTSFDTSLVTAGWVLSIYQLVGTAAMPLAGKASDILGRKFVFIFSVGLFTLGSLLCANAPSIEWLIVFRLIQAVGNGGFVPSAAGIVADRFPNARQQSLGLFSSIFPIGQIIGPNIGAWLTTNFGWRAIFWFNIPLCIIVLAASAFLLHATSRGKSSLDLAGAGLFTGSLSALMGGLTMMGNSETASWGTFILLLAISAVFMVLFLRRQSRIKDPIIDIRVLREKPFLAANIFNFVFGACVYGIYSLVPLYAVSVYGMSLLESGLVITPRSLAIMVAAAITSMKLPKWGYRKPMLIGTVMVALSLYLLAFEFKNTQILGLEFSGTVMLMAIMLFTGIGSGIASPAANNACIDLIPARVATIMGIRGMFRQSGGAIGISIATLVLHTFGSARGFTFVYAGLATLLFIVLPVVFVIPKCPTITPVTRDISDSSDTT